MLSEKPRASITTNVAISDTGMAMVGMIVVRQLCRKMKDQRLTQGDDHVVHRRRHKTCGVVMHGVGDALGEALRQLVHLVLDALLELQRVGAGHLVDGENDGRLLAEETGRGILQCPELDARDIAQPHDRASGRIGAHDDVAELGGIAQAADCVHLHLERCARRRRRLADLAGRDLDVLLRYRVLHVDGGDAEIGELVRVEPDAHRIAPFAEDLHVADAFEALDRIDDLQIGVVAQRHRIDRAVRRGEIDDEDEVRVLLLDRHASLIDDRRQ
jgi:hypothetical protein